MKTCSVCKDNKQDSEFNFKNKTACKLQSLCKTCNKEASAKHYMLNKKKHIEAVKLIRQKCIETNRKYIKDYLLNNPCVDCGESDIEILEFDHKVMVGSLGKRVSYYLSYSTDTLKNEIAKCDVRCANRHTRKTRKDLGWCR